MEVCETGEEGDLLGPNSRLDFTWIVRIGRGVKVMVVEMQ